MYKSLIITLLSRKGHFCAVFAVVGSEIPAVMPGLMKELAFLALERPF
jgi:hypothetical protein